MSLLDAAKEAHIMQRVTSDRYRTPEMIELALAWVNGEVGMAQVGRALKQVDSTKVYTMLAHALAEHVRQNASKLLAGAGDSSLPTATPGSPSRGKPGAKSSAERAAFLRTQERKG